MNLKIASLSADVHFERPFFIRCVSIRCRDICSTRNADPRRSSQAPSEAIGESQIAVARHRVLLRSDEGRPVRFAFSSALVMLGRICIALAMRSLEDEFLR